MHHLQVTSCFHCPATDICAPSYYKSRSHLNFSNPCILRLTFSPRARLRMRFWTALDSQGRAGAVLGRSAARWPRCWADRSTYRSMNGCRSEGAARLPSHRYCSPRVWSSSSWRFGVRRSSSCCSCPRSAYRWPWYAGVSFPLWAVCWHSGWWVRIWPASCPAWSWAREWPTIWFTCSSAGGQSVSAAPGQNVNNLSVFTGIQY